MDKNKITDFTDLNTWKINHELVLMIYKISSNFPQSERFGLASQIQRAAVSITSNIAEGFGRHSYKEKTQFYYMAQGSLTEVKNQLIIARDLNYVDQAVYAYILSKIDTATRLLQGLIKSSKSFIIRKP